MKPNSIQAVTTVVLCLPCATTGSNTTNKPPPPAFVPYFVLSPSTANKLISTKDSQSKPTPKAPTIANASTKRNTLLDAIPQPQPQQSDTSSTKSRRSFLHKLTTSTGIITSATAFGVLPNLENSNNGSHPPPPFTPLTSQHVAGCECDDCNSTPSSGGGMGIGFNPPTKTKNNENHGIVCECDSCHQDVTLPLMRRYGPPPAMAYETQDEDDIKRSADYYAQVKQMNETNARLTASGYKLDSKEEENAKINDAFASFSYDAATSTSKSKPSQKGGNKKNNNSKGNKNDS